MGLPEAKTGVILLKIKFFYSKTGLRFALAGHISEKVFYSNSYTGKFHMSWNVIMMAQKWVEMIKKFLFVSNYPKLLVKYVKYDEKRLPQGQNWPKQVLFSCGKLCFCAPWPWRWPSNGNLPWKPHLSQWKFLKLSVKFFFWAEKTIS